MVKLLVSWYAQLIGLDSLVMCRRKLVCLANLLSVNMMHNKHAMVHLFATVKSIKQSSAS